jgi:hypothetical protein
VSRSQATLGGTAICLSIATVFAQSSPGGSAVGFAAAVGWSVVIALWILAAAGARRSHAGRPSLAWAGVAVIAVVTSALVVANAPLALRFALGRSEMDAFATQVQSGALNSDEFGSIRGGSSDIIKDVGPYSVCCLDRTDFGFTVVVSSDPTTLWGFAYSSNGSPEGPDIDVGFLSHLEEGDNAYRHIDGPWYVWEYKST